MRLWLRFFFLFFFLFFSFFFFFFFEKSLISLLKMVSSVQSLSRVWLFATPWIEACQASLSITNYRSSLRLTSIESVMPSSHLILCHRLLLLPPIPPSIRVLSNESTLCLKWPKYWSFSFSIRWLVTGYKYVYLCWLLTNSMLFTPLCVCVCVCVCVRGVGGIIINLKYPWFTLD